MKHDKTKQHTAHSTHRTQTHKTKHQAKHRIITKENKKQKPTQIKKKHQAQAHTLKNKQATTKHITTHNKIQEKKQEKQSHRNTKLARRNRKG